MDTGKIKIDVKNLWGRLWCSWLRHCAANRKVAGSIPDGVILILHWHNPSGSTLGLGSAQPLIEMGTRNISWGDKGGRCVGLTILPPSYADCHEIWELQPPGTHRACPGLDRDCFTSCNLCRIYTSQPHVRLFRIFPKSVPLISSYPSVPPSACISVARAIRISVKFDIADFQEKSIGKIKDRLKSGKIIGRLTWEPKCISLLPATINNHKRALFAWRSNTIWG